MDVQINWWAVVLSTVAAMVIGAVWYAKPVFGKTWSKLAGVDEKAMKEGYNAGSMVVVVALSLLTSYILAHVTYIAHAFFKNSFMSDALQTAFWLWLGVAATTLIIHSMFEQKPTKLIALNVANRFVTIMAAGLIIGWLHP
jgi:Protein of unknown function (DUF1761)